METNTGPLGHGFPVAVGVALAGQLDGSPRRTFVLCGDGELQEGSMWEAAMSASHFGLDRLTLIVDRNGLQQGDTTERTMGLDPLADRFRAFGWAVREVDGHDHAALLEAFARDPVRDRAGPVCLIAHTHKGQGVSFISDQVAWHHHIPTAEEYERARGELEAQLAEIEASRSLASGCRPAGDRGRDGRRPRDLRMTADVTPRLHDCRDAFADTLLELVAADPRVIAVVNDSLGSTKVAKVAKAFPDRVINVGIAEQNLVGVGGRPGQRRQDPLRLRGLAVPHGPGPRADQGRRRLQRGQREARGRQQRRGLRRAGADPSLHRGRGLDPRHRRPRRHRARRPARDEPGHPRGVRARRSRLRADQPHARAGRPARPDHVFRIGRAARLRDGDDVTHHRQRRHGAPGAARPPTILAADGIEARVLDMATASPIDRDAIADAARQTRGIVTAEEHIVRGGLGGAVAEVVVEEHPVPMRILGFPGFAPTGSIDFLLAWAGLTAEGIAAAAREVLEA